MYTLNKLLRYLKYTLLLNKVIKDISLTNDYI